MYKIYRSIWLRVKDIPIFFDYWTKIIYKKLVWTIHVSNTYYEFEFSSDELQDEELKYFIYANTIKTDTNVDITSKNSDSEYAKSWEVYYKAIIY